jgi:hypothetical protein
MPYKRAGNRVLVKKSGKWKTKQVCKSVDKAKAAIRILKSKTGH